MINHDEIAGIVSNFCVDGEYVSAELHPGGHIHETYLVATRSGNQYILQRINQHVFPKPMELMENIYGVTRYLREQIIQRDGDAKRETLTLILTKNGQYTYTDIRSQIWRMYLFIEGSMPCAQPFTVFSVTAAGMAFGRFSQLLADYPVNQLKETIPNFHNTPLRVKQLKEAVQNNPCRRAGRVRYEIDFALVSSDESGDLVDLQKRGILPTRVTHNDAKLSNVLLDRKTREGLCVVDLDTVMPGLTACDFGDGARSCSNSVADDETNLNHVYFRTDMFEAYAVGYLAGCSRSLKSEEYAALPYGVKLMTYELGVRYLTDYINGDQYFRVKHPEQNIDRARNQFRLLQDIERKWGTVCSIVDKKKQELSRMGNNRLHYNF